MSNGNLETAKVVILMGSDSDLPRMKQCLASLGALEIPYDIRVASAHRTPQRVKDIVARAEKAGVEVFICAAGGAAHLAGATLNYSDGLQGAGFSIDNPNAQRSCGCGQSFS